MHRILVHSNKNHYIILRSSFFAVRSFYDSKHFSKSPVSDGRFPISRKTEHQQVRSFGRTYLYALQLTANNFIPFPAMCQAYAVLYIVLSIFLQFLLHRFCGVGSMVIAIKIANLHKAIFLLKNYFCSKQILWVSFSTVPPILVGHY